MNKKSNKWLENTYYVGMLASLFFIMSQAYYAKRSIIQSSDWEKAKMTIENIERFKENLVDSPLSEVWLLGDKLWADFSNPERFHLSAPLRQELYSLFDNDNNKVQDEVIRMIEIMDAFAYPIIMGYASEEASYQSVARQYYTYGSFVMPEAFRSYRSLGFHAKLLHRLWRIRYEQLVVDIVLNGAEGASEMLIERKEHLLYYDGTEFTETSLKEYRKKLEGKLKDMQKEIEAFRKNSLK